MYEVEYRIVVSCRNGNIYTIKKGKVWHYTHFLFVRVPSFSTRTAHHCRRPHHRRLVQVIGTVIELETQPCGLEVIDKNIVVTPTRYSDTLAIILNVASTLFSYD
jgi:hypothetical protein